MKKIILPFLFLFTLLFASPVSAWLRQLHNVTNNPLFWDMHDNTTPMPYAVNPNITATNADGNASTVVDIIDTVQNAAGIWNDQGNARFSFVFDGQTDIAAVVRDGINVVAEQAFCEDSTTAFSQIVHRLETGEILEVDIMVCASHQDVFDKDKDGDFLEPVSLAWFADRDPNEVPPRGKSDLWGTLVHEFGHNLGLDHPFADNPPQEVCSVMQYYTQLIANNCNNGERRNNRNLFQDDISGVQAIYGILNDFDSDDDGILDDVDNCSIIPNADQRNNDRDGMGDVCDEDDDEDDLSDVDEAAFGSDPFIKDTDGDGFSDKREWDLGLNPLEKNDLLISILDLVLEDNSAQRSDLDGDGILNDVDNCPNFENPDQVDYNRNGIGLYCDTDEQDLIKRIMDILGEFLPYP